MTPDQRQQTEALSRYSNVSREELRLRLEAPLIETFQRLTAIQAPVTITAPAAPRIEIQTVTQQPSSIITPPVVDLSSPGQGSGAGTPNQTVIVFAQRMLATMMVSGTDPVAI